MSSGGGGVRGGGGGGVPGPRVPGGVTFGGGALHKITVGRGSEGRGLGGGCGCTGGDTGGGGGGGDTGDVGCDCTGVVG